MSSLAPPTFPKGSMLGRYRIERRLGLGGMGEVYEAWHADLNKRVAVKTLLPALTSRPELRARFLREGQATARLRHPHAVDVSDVGVEGETPFLVMEFLDGETLEALVAREAPLTMPRVAELMLPVIAAVKAAHDEDIVHRDLKPANIFLHQTRDRKTVPKVLDFGISKMADDDGASPLTQTASLLGTPHYMSPEQLRSSKYVDARSDQYALGAILYECATGQKPFHGETMFLLMNAIVNGHFMAPRARVPSIPAEFERLVVRAMNLDPSQRFESLRALGCSLLAFAEPRVRDQWESVFDGAAATAWVQSSPTLPPRADAPASLAGARNSVLPTPPPGTFAGAAVHLASTSAPSPPRRVAPIVAGLTMLAAVAGLTVAAAQRFVPVAPAGYVAAQPSSAVPQAAPLQAPAPPAVAERPASTPTSPPPVVPATTVPSTSTVVAAPREMTTPAARRRGRRRGRRHGDDVAAPMFETPIATSTNTGTNSIPILR
jgi:hypothetical protein